MRRIRRYKIPIVLFVGCLSVFFLAVFISPTLAFSKSSLDNKSQTYPSNSQTSPSLNNLSSAGRETEQSIAINREPIEFTKTEKVHLRAIDYSQLQDGTYLTDNNFHLIIKDGIASIEDVIIVNKSFPVPESVASNINSETRAAFNEMAEAIKAEDMRIRMITGYRDYDTQDFLFSSYLAQDTKENVERYSARPGYSEHHLGQAMDIGAGSQTTALNFRLFEESEWVKHNAYKFGFIKRYPEDAEVFTGYMYEPWHYRYVGKDLAEKLYNNGDWISLEEYFGIKSEYLD